MKTDAGYQTKGKTENPQAGHYLARYWDSYGGKKLKAAAVEKFRVCQGSV